MATVGQKRSAVWSRVARAAYGVVMCWTAPDTIAATRCQAYARARMGGMDRQERATVE